MTDPAVFRPSTGQWFILTSGSNYTANIVVSWGVSTDVPLQGDYDGDGKADPAVYRPSTGQWFVLTSGSNYTASIVHTWGVSTDVPLPVALEVEVRRARKDEIDARRRHSRQQIFGAGLADVGDPRRNPRQGANHSIEAADLPARGIDGDVAPVQR
jgi:hypothetical protein